MTLDCRRLLHPASVAVVGATERPGSYGAQALHNLRTTGYPGEVWGVNPKRSTVLGFPCVATVADLPTPVDAVVVAIPAAGVPDVVAQVGARGCGGAVVFSAGFAEVNACAGLQAELVAAAERYRIPVCGPNCNGIVSPRARVALWGDALAPQTPGPVALISQSGNVAVNALAARRGLRFHTVIASGNQAVLGAADYLELLAAEEGVRSIAVYLEDDGGPRLCEGLAACVDAGIRLAVLKVGSSPAGARAAAAHSAALAGDQRVFRSLVQEAGGAWADDVHELLELAKTLSVPAPARSPSGAGLAIMTCSGGDSAQGADEAARCGLALAPIAPPTRARLSQRLPAAATVANPLDYTAMLWGDSAALSDLVRAVGEDPSVGQVLVFYDQPHGLTGASAESWRAVRDGIIAGARSSPAQTLVSSTLPELLADESACEFLQADVAAVAGLRTGLRCAAAARLRTPADSARLREIAAYARAAKRCRAKADGWLAEHEAKELLRTAGVPVVAGRVVSSEEDAVLAFRELGGWVAIKVSATAVQHKSELGAVALDLSSEPALRGVYRRLDAVAQAHGGTVLVEQMIASGVELIVAARTDAVVPALVLGLGGVWTEVLGDVAIVPLPASQTRVARALATLRGASLLTGERGRVPVDLDAVAELAVRVGRLLLERSLSLVELNPVIASPAGAVAVDAALQQAGHLPAPAREAQRMAVGV